MLCFHLRYPCMQIYVDNCSTSVIAWSSASTEVCCVFQVETCIPGHNLPPAATPVCVVKGGCCSLCRAPPANPIPAQVKYCNSDPGKLDSDCVQGHFQIVLSNEHCPLFQTRLSWFQRIMYCSGVWSYVVRASPLPKLSNVMYIYFIMAISSDRWER